MSTSKLLGLPPISPELKSIAPYLQRAEELKSKEPIMAYWCAYHAAQVGISIKAKDNLSRNLLFELLGTLEQMKKAIGPNDAIDIESASAAYVENFALKIFSMADNEDRRGVGTRSTAKKFLAAANFLEVLKIFPKSEISDSNEEKIRYAKWKAADIAKAFREGRQPVPGPAGSGLSPESVQSSLPSQSAGVTPPSNASTNTLSTATTSTYATNNSATSSTSTLGGGSSPPRKTVSPPNPHIKRVSPPPHFDPSDIARANNFDPQTPPRSGRGDFLGVDVGESTPGNWSTVATPGTARETPSVWDDDAPRRLDVLPEPDSPMARKGKNRDTSRSGSGSSGSSVEVGSRKAWVSGELENATGMGDEPFTYDGNGNANAIALGLGSKKTVHFTPSVVGGLSSTSGTPPVSPGWVDPPKISRSTSLSSSGPLPNPNLNPTHPLVSPKRSTTDLPAGFVPDGPPSDGHIGWVGGGGVNISPSRQSDIIQPNFIPNVNDVSSRPQPPTIYALPPPPAPSPPYIPPAAPVPTRIYPRPHPPPPPPPAPEIELTPVTIAKAQKHCRFAISALDYEDAEQARKELRAALAVLGG